MKTTIKNEVERITQSFNVKGEYKDKAYTLVAESAKLQHLEMNEKYPQAVITLALQIVDIVKWVKEEQQINKEIENEILKMKMEVAQQNV